MGHTPPHEHGNEGTGGSELGTTDSPVQVTADSLEVINSGSTIDLGGNLIQEPDTTGSATDPRADTTADDWLKIQIGATTFYLPLYS